MARLRHPTLVLFLTVLAAFEVGAFVGYRARISEEEVIVHPMPMLPTVPGDLSWS
jgi:hypothetical protein